MKTLTSAALAILSALCLATPAHAAQETERWSFEPTSYDFGARTPNASVSARKAFTLTNTGQVEPYADLYRNPVEQRGRRRAGSIHRGIGQLRHAGTRCELHHRSGLQPHPSGSEGRGPHRRRRETQSIRGYRKRVFRRSGCRPGRLGPASGDRLRAEGFGSRALAVPARQGRQRRPGRPQDRFGVARTRIPLRRRPVRPGAGRDMRSRRDRASVRILHGARRLRSHRGQPVQRRSAHRRQCAGLASIRDARRDRSPLARRAGQSARRHRRASAEGHPEARGRSSRSRDRQARRNSSAGSTQIPSSPAFRRSNLPA